VLLRERRNPKEMSDSAISRVLKIVE